MRIAFLLAFILVGCGETPEVEPSQPPGAMDTTGEVVATVNGDPVTTNMVGALTRRIPPEQLAQMKETGKYTEMINQVALGQALYSKAIEEGIHEDPQVQDALAMQAREVLAGEYLQKVANEAITDERVAEYYEQRKVQFSKPMVNAKHILLKQQDKADDIKAQLDAGAEFAELAELHSEDQATRQKGGDLGWFEKRRMIREVSDAAFGAEKGQILGPIESRHGFHVIKVLDKRNDTPIEEVRPQIEKALRQETIDAKVKEIRAGLTVEITGEEKATEDDKPPGEVTPPLEDEPAEKAP